MIVRVLSVGSPDPLLRGAIAEFEKRAGRYWKVRSEEVRAGVGGGNPDPTRVRGKEGERLRGRLPERGELVALTREGKGMSSPGLARLLQRRAAEGVPEVTFLVGGAFGLDPALLEKAALRFSLSPLTLPHDLARLLLFEQLYRAGTILRGEPYHKGRS